MLCHCCSWTYTVLDVCMYDTSTCGNGCSPYCIQSIRGCSASSSSGTTMNNEAIVTGKSSSGANNVRQWDLIAPHSLWRICQLCTCQCCIERISNCSHQARRKQTMWYIRTYMDCFYLRSLYSTHIHMSEQCRPKLQIPIQLWYNFWWDFLSLRVGECQSYSCTLHWTWSHEECLGRSMWSFHLEWMGDLHK